MEEIMIFSDKLKKERLRKGYTLQQMAEILGISLARYKRYEGGEIKFRYLNAEILCNICKALDVRAHYLLGLQDKYKP